MKTRVIKSKAQKEAIRRNGAIYRLHGTKANLNTILNNGLTSIEEKYVLDAISSLTSAIQETKKK